MRECLITQSLGFFFCKYVYCDGVEARPGSGREHVVAEAKMTGETEENP